MIKDLIKSDLYRYVGKSKVGFLEKRRLYGYQYLRSWRILNYYITKNKLLFLLFGFTVYKKSIKYGFQISPYAKIGEGLYLGHFGTVVIGNKVEIGKNVNIGVNVIIGATNRGKHQGSPKIGNRVWIGSNCTIVGNIIIGDNVLIAPNTYCNFDIPSNSIVLGNPVCIISSETATDKYIENVV